MLQKLSFNKEIVEKEEDQMKEMVRRIRVSRDCFELRSKRHEKAKKKRAKRKDGKKIQLK